jgi:hypothetical protein
VTQQVLSTFIIDIRGLAWVGGVNGNYTPLIVALIVSVVLLYWAFQVVWTPVTPKAIVSVNTDNPMLFGDWVLYFVTLAVIIFGVFGVASAIFPNSLPNRLSLTFFTVLFLRLFDKGSK